MKREGTTRGTRGTRFLCLLCFLWFLPSLYAHDIPADVTIQAFIKPEGSHLHYLVRVPMKAMRDIEFPKRGPGFLDMTRVDENDTRLPKPRIVDARVSVESDRSFASYEQAAAHVTGPRLPDNVDLYWDQAMLDVLMDYPIQSDRSRFSIHPGYERLGLRVVTVLRFLPPNGAVRGFEFTEDPGLLRLDPSWLQASLRFVQLGFWHILGGIDHLLFLFCLVIPFRRFRALITIVTSFTIAHSITLIASAFNLGPETLWFPPLIETLIAISILYMALE